MRFEVYAEGGEWMVSDGAVRFGLYATRAKAEASAAALNGQRAWSSLSLSELIGDPQATAS